VKKLGDSGTLTQKEIVLEEIRWQNFFEMHDYCTPSPRPLPQGEGVIEGVSVSESLVLYEHCTPSP